MNLPNIGGGFRRSIPDNFSGIVFEVERMKEYVRHFSGDPYCIKNARRIVLDCPPHDHLAEAVCLYEFTKTHVRFVPDPTGKEGIQRIDSMLDAIAREGKASGDCDEFATFLAGLLACIGQDVAFRFGGTGPAGFHHVWVRAIVPEFGPVDLDATEDDLHAGEVLPFDFYATEEIFT